MKYRLVTAGVSALFGMALASSASAETFAITPDAFSGNETVITFAHSPDWVSIDPRTGQGSGGWIEGDPLVVDGVTFDNLNSGKLASGYYYGWNTRHAYVGKISDDGQLYINGALSNFTITFPDDITVNRVGMLLGSGYDHNKYAASDVKWFYEAYGLDDAFLGSGVVEGVDLDLGNGGTHASMAFLGFESTESISWVRVFQQQIPGYIDGDVTIMDDLRFEAVDAAAVPLPAPVFAGMALFGLMAARHGLCRRKNSDD